MTPSIASFIRVVGSVPPEDWNVLGHRLLPELRGAGEVTLDVDVPVALDTPGASPSAREFRTILGEMGLASAVRVEEEGARDPRGGRSP